MDHLAEIEDMLAQAKLRVTLSRLLVLDILNQAPGELAAWEIEQQLLNKQKKMNISAIYSILKTLEYKGLVQRFKVAGHHAYFSLNKSIGLVKCRCNVCAQMQHMDEALLQQCIVQYCEAAGLKLKSYSTLIDVICQKCSQK
ncbi:Fur family transcriptional regulator [Acinetobacter larvae]|uniref:Transcriptional repressor n=1 Tax=Acinetobacter larvae TaxID=1789224 RepID=A0A1B2M1I2_9GAMM|nr:transcriptional repressor [Acinetobacter larvae]AOA59052.1 hypothetical protein BFG52_12295 [Acinetobacter larvae]